MRRFKFKVTLLFSPTVVRAAKQDKSRSGVRLHSINRLAAFDKGRGIGKRVEFSSESGNDRQRRSATAVANSFDVLATVAS